MSAPDKTSPARPWRPAPLLLASAGVHAAALAGLALAPAAWPGLVAALVANHALIAAGGLLPRSRLLGPNLTRLPDAAAARREVALTFDDGPDAEITPRVLDLLDAAGARASFFCIGTRAERHPRVVREIAARGHRLENHSYRHSHAFWFLPWRALLDEIERTQRVLQELGGAAPRYFRAPAGLRSPLLEPALARTGLTLASWTRRGFDTVSRDPRAVAARLTNGLAAGDVLLFHDGRGHVGSGDVVLGALPHVLSCLSRDGLRGVPLE